MSSGSSNNNFNGRLSKQPTFNFSFDPLLSPVPSLPKSDTPTAFKSVEPKQSSGVSSSFSNTSDPPKLSCPSAPPVKTLSSAVPLPSKSDKPNVLGFVAPTQSFRDLSSISSTSDLPKFHSFGTFVKEFPPAVPSPSKADKPYAFGFVAPSSGVSLPPKSISNENGQHSFSPSAFGSYFLVSATFSLITCVLPTFLGIRASAGPDGQMQMSDDVTAWLGKKH